MFISKFGLTLILVSIVAPALVGQVPEYIDDVNEGTLSCYPTVASQCADYAQGFTFSLSMTGSALCHNGQPVLASIAVYANCSNLALGDVYVYIAQYPHAFFDPNSPTGYSNRWYGGLYALATGSGTYGGWQAHDSNYCDGYRDSFTEPNVPC